MIIKHSWESTGFHTWVCTKCGCEKVEDMNSDPGHHFFYYRNGVPLVRLPQCYSVIHSDPIY